MYPKDVSQAQSPVISEQEVKPPLVPPLLHKQPLKDPFYEMSIY